MESINYIIDKYGNYSAYEINKMEEIQKLYELGESKLETGVLHIKADKLLTAYGKNETN